jgi:hypothetical protein
LRWESHNGAGLRGALAASLIAEMMAMLLGTEASAAAEVNNILAAHGLGWRLVMGNA